MRRSEITLDIFQLIYVPYDMVDTGRQVAIWKYSEGDWCVIHRWMDIPREFGQEIVIHKSEICGIASFTDIRTLRAAREFQLHNERFAQLAFQMMVLEK